LGISQSEKRTRFPDVVVGHGLVVDGELAIVHESYKTDMIGVLRENELRCYLTCACAGHFGLLSWVTME